MPFVVRTARGCGKDFKQDYMTPMTGPNNYVAGVDSINRDDPEVSLKSSIIE